MNKDKILIFLGAALLLSGCGIKGPLYMPADSAEVCGSYPDDECQKTNGKENASERFVRGPADDENIYFNPLYSL